MQDLRNEPGASARRSEVIGTAIAFRGIRREGEAKRPPDASRPPRTTQADKAPRTERYSTMEEHQRLMMIRDLLDRLSDNAAEWEQAEDQAANYWADHLRRDMAELRRVCATLKTERTHDRTLACVH